MTSKEFQEFLNKQAQVKVQENKIDWETEKNKWIEHANQFVNAVKEHLTEFSEIETKVVPISLTEDEFGTYTVPKLVIYLPKEMIELIPVGAILVGAHGRFDLKGLAGTVKWVLVSENTERPSIKITINGEDKRQQVEQENSEKLVWKLATPAPNIRYLPFEKEILLESIMEVSHG